MANNYKLTFVELFKLGTKDIVFTYNQESTSTQQVGINNKNCDLTLMSFSYSKAMYLPGELLITLKLMSINGSLSFSDIEAAHNLLMSKYINVEFQDSLTDSETFYIAELFRVFDVQVEKRMASGDTLSVVVKAFDPLKHLTLDKFCSAYTCKKLIKDVIMNEKVWPVMAPVNIKDELTNAKTAMEEINKLIQPIETYGYFKVPEFTSSYDNYIESSMAGFASHSSQYDVGVIFDRELGMFIVPFYGTLCHICETENYKEITGWDECIKSFMENDKIPANLVKKLAAKYPNFISILNEVYGTDRSLEEFLEEYKLHYLKNKIYSPTSVLYSSKAFSDLMGFIPNEEQLKAKEIQENQGATIGRNDPCPCGSGKKYKKCCGAMV